MLQPVILEEPGVSNAKSGCSLGPKGCPPGNFISYFSGLSNLAGVSLIPEGGEAVQAQKSCLLWGPKLSMSQKQDGL